TRPRRGNAIAPDDLAARKRVTPQPGYLPALADIVVDDRLLGRGRDSLAPFRAPHHKVGVGAGYDGALAWVDVEDLRDVRGGYRHGLVRCQPACFDASGPQHGKAIFDPARAVGNPGEVVEAKALLLHGEGGVVGGDGMQ